MTRRPRVPGTTGAVYRREVACGVDPTRALVRALAEFRQLRRGQIWTVDIAHDWGCPSLVKGGMAVCTCELVRLEGRRAA